MRFISTDAPQMSMNQRSSEAEDSVGRQPGSAGAAHQGSGDRRAAPLLSRACFSGPISRRLNQVVERDLIGPSAALGRLGPCDTQRSSHSRRQVRPTSVHRSEASKVSTLR